jgi:hypothetical protein
MGYSFFRAGIFEHDKRKVRQEHRCAGPDCTATIPKRRRFCGPCYDRRLMENIARNRHKYRPKKPAP